jgi:EAL domain-containing protein (putative c-di-GMP-specific phosphodiesterase class I)
VLDRLRPTYYVGGTALTVTTSIGLALGLVEEDSVDDLLSKADAAMYAAKRAGKNRLAIFEPAMRAATAEGRLLRDELSLAIERREFVLYYQPIQLLASGRVMGVEALLRWHHPTRGFLAPDAFLQVAERTGLITEIGRWALQEAASATARWQERYRPDPALLVSVNVSARQLETASFVDHVTSALHASGLDPRQLILEITETVLITDPEIVAMQLAVLSAHGVHVAIDDFGAGYSSLSYLRSLPVDFIKIDRSYIELLNGDAGPSALTRAICKMAHTLGIATIAEGIETAHQLDRLRRMDCDYGQGYGLARPMPGEEFEHLLCLAGGSVTSGAASTSSSSS